ncbi:hypothetical protein Syun_013003 [Stephania yunnanensis]|uniref:Uncharacterized protein n=1 Tax=Stephania yunnanensis TaxID=152371 RepID=A0AAP0PFW4_9MAGN
MRTVTYETARFPFDALALASSFEEDSSSFLDLPARSFSLYFFSFSSKEVPLVL